MYELQVPTDNVAAQVRMDRGEPLDGRFYATEDVYSRGPTERLLEILNDERKFLPFEPNPATGTRILLSKVHIVSVRAAPTAEGSNETEAELGDATEPCTLKLSDGSIATGIVRVDTPMSSNRIVDKLNHAETFLQLVMEDGILLVQRDQIVATS